MYMILIMLMFMLILLIYFILLMLNLFLKMMNKLNREKITPFECGFNSHSDMMPFAIHYFLIALYFLIFDIEIILIIPLITLIKFNYLYTMFYIMIFFFFFIIISLIYEWIYSLLEWI